MTDPYDINPEATEVATETVLRILVQEIAGEISMPEETVAEVLSSFSVFLARLRPQEAFGLCGNIVQRGHDLNHDQQT